jgi:hypothetical protein
VNILGVRVVVHARNPSYSGGGDWVDQGLRSAWAKKLARHAPRPPPVSVSKLGMVACVYNLGYAGGIDGKITD